MEIVQGGANWKEFKFSAEDIARGDLSNSNENTYCNYSPFVIVCTFGLVLLFYAVGKM